MRVIIIGAGGHGQVVADILFKMWTKGRDIELAGYLDNDPKLLGRRFLGLEVLGDQSLLDEINHDAVVVALGDNKRRRQVQEQLAASGEQFVAAIHPSAVLAADVCVERGAMICAGVIINPGAAIGAGAILNTGCTVDHHCRIAPFSHLGPGSHLAGNVHVGQGCLVGIGTSVIPGVSLGDWAVVGAGSAVVEDVPQGQTWGGVPAKPLH